MIKLKTYVLTTLLHVYRHVYTYININVYKLYILYIDNYISVYILTSMIKIE